MKESFQADAPLMRSSLWPKLVYCSDISNLYDKSLHSEFLFVG